jgi:hypothetical protein
MPGRTMPLSVERILLITEKSQNIPYNLRGILAATVDYLRAPSLSRDKVRRDGFSRVGVFAVGSYAIPPFVWFLLIPKMVLASRDRFCALLLTYLFGGGQSYGAGDITRAGERRLKR